MKRYKAATNSPVSKRSIIFPRSKISEEGKENEPLNVDDMMRSGMDISPTGTKVKVRRQINQEIIVKLDTV